MAVDKSSVSYMKGYLKHAIEFEKYVYIWSQAMDEVNCRMRQIYSERKRLESTKATARTRLASLDDTNERQRRYKESEAARYRKKSKNALVTTVVLLILLFLIGVGIGYALLNDPDTTFIIPRGAVIPVLGVTVMIVGSLFTGILPICLGVFFSNKSKAVRFQKEAKQLASRASGRRQEIILQAQESEAENDWIVNNIEESVVSQRQEEIHNALITAKNNLLQIYSENVLPQKYRSLTAVATLYEYLETGRCNTIQGHGGIYDTYEVEKIHLAQLQQMVQMNETLSRIEDNQRYICQELRQANRTLPSINASLSEIEKTNAEIAKNTAISAAANQQTAAAAQWMAWRAWANGY